MKLKTIFLLALSLLIALMPISAAAENGHEQLVSDLYARACNGLSLQEWLNRFADDLAGSTSEGYIISLNRSGEELDYSEYIRAASQKLQEGSIRNPVSAMRCALTLASCGAAQYIPEGFADECIGKLGVMSYVYGLHLLNNGVASQLWTSQMIIDKLLELQKEDGGWAVMGQFGDVDVTAMCLQALAACESEEKMNAAIAAGVDMLSERQLDSAGFISNGNENSESAAQVIIALSTLGIDPVQDERFVKNGLNPVDALLSYQLPGGGFSHLPGDALNETACVQALQALHALQLHGQPYFIFEKGAVVLQKKALLSGWKMYAMIAVAVFALAGTVFALTRRYGRMKQLILVLLLAGLAAAGILLLDVETADDYYRADESRPSIGTVHLSIRCDTVAGRAQDGSTPEDGVILERTAMPLSEGDSVFDILTDAARKFTIHVEHDGGSGDTAYVTGINYLYEQGYGELSGWLYDVNGERYSVGSGAYLLSDGDEIIWRYTLELGEDLK